MRVSLSSTLPTTRTAVRLGLPAALAALALAAPAALAQSPAAAAPPELPVPLPLPTGAASEPAKAQTELRISGPGGTVDPGPHTIGVRLLADDRPVQNGEVRLERRTDSGWSYAGRLLTDSRGLGQGELDFSSSTRLRAVYEGSSGRTAATSREIVVQVADFRQQALKVASQQDGDPYRRGGEGPDSFDCSGLVRYSFAKAGKQLPHNSAEQERVTRDIPRSEMEPGDLVFISSGGRVGHVGIYAGDGKFWDAPTSGGHVSLRKIWTDRYEVGRVD